SFLQIGKRGGNGLSAIDIVAAIEPEFAARRRKLGKPAMGKPLHARRPFHLNHGGFEGCSGKSQSAHPQRRNGGSGILELMPAVKFRRGQIEKAVLVLVDEPA